MEILHKFNDSLISDCKLMIFLGALSLLICLGLIQFLNEVCYCPFFSSQNWVCLILMGMKTKKFSPKIHK